MALTFGVERAPVRDRYIGTDPIFARTVIDFARVSQVSQPTVATLIRLSNLVVLDAIVRNETATEPLGLALVKGLDGNAVEAFQLLHGTELELRQHLFGPSLQDERRRPPKFIEQLVTINLTALIAGVRRNAEVAGFDLGAPLFLMPDDPTCASIQQELAEIATKEKLQLEKEAAGARAALRQRITQNVMIR